MYNQFGMYTKLGIYNKFSKDKEPGHYAAHPSIAEGM